MADVMRTDLTRMSHEQRIWSVTIFARVTLAAGFLSAVADRFGLWAEAGTNQVGWGNFETFTQYVQTLAPYLPDTLVTAAAWGATAVEILLGGTLLLGVKIRWAALGSAATLVVFAVSMFIFAGFETPLSASVFTAAAAALLLVLAPPGSYTVRPSSILDKAVLDHLHDSSMAISACVAVDPIADGLVAKIAERATSIKTGDGTGDADMGPLVTEARGPPRQGGLLHRRRRDRRRQDRRRRAQRAGQRW
jgi:uncharacterized membrane protein YphA (DoxX/SURF4 family)